MRVWSALVAATGLLMACAVPAQAHAAADGPAVSVAPIGVVPPVFNGVCSPGVEFTASVTITADGPGTVTYQWDSLWQGQGGRLTFTEAGTKTVSGITRQYSGWGLRHQTITVTGTNQVKTSVPYTLGCIDPVPGGPQIQPAADYVGRCGSDVVHTVSAQITSPIAQTVRYRWVNYDGNPIPGAEGEREVVFTEPGAKSVTAPFQRVPIPGTNMGHGVKVQIVSPGTAQSANGQYYRTVCVSAEFTEMTRTAGNCRTGTPYKYVMNGYVESNAIGRMSYAWARYDSLEGAWVRDAWTPMSFVSYNSPGRQNVSRTWLSADGGSGVWRLEVLGTDGTVVSQSRPYSIPCVA
ncbi:hypothetical protein ACIBG7_26955 [Nonomuraea sp. NPDC050328]|uniref:hypothetical protein n=1 Tax=Nonomuraea sp. NPDC050328 TaxID=3364361 RepID=UPI0037A1A2DF